MLRGKFCTSFGLKYENIFALQKQFDVLSITSPTLNLGAGCLAFFPKYYTMPIIPAQLVFMEGQYPSSTEVETAMFYLGEDAWNFEKVEKAVDSGDKSVKDMRKLIVAKIVSHSACRPDNSVLIRYKNTETVITFNDKAGCEDFARTLTRENVNGLD